MKTLIQNAAAVVTCDAADTVYRGADILIEDGVITKIGANLSVCGAEESINAGGKFVYPGLVNTHHHFFQTFVRNTQKIDYPGITLLEWLDRIYRIFAEIDDEVIYYSSLVAMADLLKHGCTTAFDHQYCFTKKTGKKPVDRQMEAAALLGIRYHAGRGCNTLPREKGSTIPDEMREDTDEFLADCERLIARYNDPSPNAMTRVALAPCQPVNCYPETFIEAAKLARKHGVRLHTHLAEGETAAMVERWGKRTLAWAEDIGFLGPDLWLAHAWELTPEEHKIAGKYGVGVAHCPTPAILGGCPILDIPAMTRAGMTVALGCDGSATNDGSSLLDTLRLAYLFQAWYTKTRGPVSAYDVLKMGTVNGAKVLGRPELGWLGPGQGADLFMIDSEKLELAGALHDPKNLIAHAAVTGPVYLTMVRGKTVWREGVLTGLPDESETARRSEACCTKALRSKFPDVFAG